MATIPTSPSTAASTPTPTETAATGGASADETATPTPTPKPKPKPPLLQAGKEQALNYKQGETVRFRVVNDEAEEVHVHGYDIKQELEPGKVETVSFKATIPGIFEIELEAVRHPARAAQGCALARGKAVAHAPGHEPGVTKLLQSRISRYVSFASPPAAEIPPAAVGWRACPPMPDAALTADV